MPISGRFEPLVLQFAADLEKILRQAIAAEVRNTTDPPLRLPNRARGAAAESAPAAKVRPSGKRPRGRAASPETVLAYVQKNPGQRTEQISKGLSADAKPALAKLRAQGKVKTKGDRRTTTYSAA